jgi:hypothetical protein
LYALSYFSFTVQKYTHFLNVGLCLQRLSSPLLMALACECTKVKQKAATHAHERELSLKPFKRSQLTKINPPLSAKRLNLTPRRAASDQLSAIQNLSRAVETKKIKSSSGRLGSLATLPGTMNGWSSLHV